MIKAAFNKPLFEATPAEVYGLIDGSLDAPNPLFSEELTTANRQVRATGNADMIDAFSTTAAVLMQGDYACAGGYGFDLRNATGLAVQRMLKNGDTASIDRVIAAPEANDPILKASLKTMRAELKAHCLSNGLTIHSTKAPAVADAVAHKPG